MSITKIKFQDYKGDISKRWYVEYFEDGKRHRKFVNDTNDPIERRRIARNFMELLNRSDASMTPISDGYISVFGKWLEVRKNKFALKTYQTYKSRIFKLSEFLTFHRFHTNVETVSRFYDSLLQKGHANSYINSFFDLFSQICADEKITDIFDVKKLRANKQPYLIFNRTQIRAMIAKMKEQDYQLYMAACLLFYCFIRPSELRQLKVEDIDFLQKTIRIRAEISKNKKSQYVKIPDVFSDTLVNYVGSASPSDYLFCKLGGSTGAFPYKKDAINRRHKILLADLGYEGLSLYSWKPTGMVELLKAGVSLKDIQLQARHHSLDMVNVYLSHYGILISKVEEQSPLLESL